jgi:hypothetical protein
MKAHRCRSEKAIAPTLRSFEEDGSPSIRAGVVKVITRWLQEDWGPDERKSDPPALPS